MSNANRNGGQEGHESQSGAEWPPDPSKPGRRPWSPPELVDLGDVTKRTENAGGLADDGSLSQS